MHGDLFGRNVAQDNVSLHRVALGERQGMVSITVPPDQTGHAHVADGARRHEQRGGHLSPDRWHRIGAVPIVTLDSFDLGPVAFIKIDVEGYELPVLKGARETLLRCQPILVVEQKGNDASVYGGRHSEAVHWLRSLGARDLEVISGDHIMGW